MTNYEIYKNYLEQKYGRKIEKLNIELDGEYVNLRYTFAKVPFNRIRRITGYLTGDISTWNDAKQAELNDRVKHNTHNIEKL